MGQPNQPQHGHQLLCAVLVIATTALAAIVVVVTRDTEGLEHLATLVLTISAVVLPLATGRKTRRGRR